MCVFVSPLTFPSIDLLHLRPSPPAAYETLGVELGNGTRSSVGQYARLLGPSPMLLSEISMVTTVLEIELSPSEHFVRSGIGLALRQVNNIMWERCVSP